MPELFAAQAAARRTPSRWSARTRRSATASSTRARTSWRIICARSASGPRSSSGCASSARSTWWSRSSPSSRPAPPTCRSIRTIRKSASPSCWRTPARRSWSRSPRCATACPRTDARIVDLDADRAAIARQPATRPPGASTRAPPPTSSTPRARPDNPKASPSRMRDLPILALVEIERFGMSARRRRAAVRVAQLRRRGLGDLSAAAHAAPRSSSRREKSRGDRQLCAARSATQTRSRSATPAAGIAAGRTCADDLPLATLVVAGEALSRRARAGLAAPGRPAVQSLRTDRDHGLSRPSAIAVARWPKPSADRPSDLEHAGLRSGRRLAACSGWCERASCMLRGWVWRGAIWDVRV